jgi:putative PIN family toxin of toxin-antitoxin system
MKIILNTNVFISGIFFTGPPSHILKAWRDGKVQLLVSPSILYEYQRIGAELALQFQDVDLKPFLDLLTLQAEIVLAPTLPPVIRDDPSDDKFLEAAVAGNASGIISGDKHLLKLSEFQGIQILKPRDFAQRYLKSKGKK